MDGTSDYQSSVPVRPLQRIFVRLGQPGLTLKVGARKDGSQGVGGAASEPELNQVAGEQLG